MNTTFLYLRVSTDEQAKSGLGLDAQRTKCLAMAVVKGWTVPEEQIFVDAGISGTKGPKKRPALAQLLAAIRAKPGNAVIVSSLDRLARNTKLTLKLVDEITDKYGANTAFVSCRESLDTTTAAGQFVLTIFAAMYQLDRDLISERTTNALAELKDRGMQYGTPPFGFRRGKEHIVNRREELLTRYELIPNVDEVAIVRLIATMAQEGMSTRKIASSLNADGYRTRGSRKRGTDLQSGKDGGTWTKTQVIRVLGRMHSILDDAHIGDGFQPQNHNS